MTHHRRIATLTVALCLALSACLSETGEAGGVDATSADAAETASGAVDAQDMNDTLALDVSPMDAAPGPDPDASFAVDVPAGEDADPAPEVTPAADTATAQDATQGPEAGPTADAEEVADALPAPDVQPQPDVAPEPDVLPEPDVVCVPECGDKACGEDGCGGVCGLCDEDAVCDADGQCEAVVLELADQIQALLADDLELPALTNALDLDEVEAQAVAYPGSVEFITALELAMTSFLTDDDDLESPLGIASFVAEVTWDPDNPEGQTFAEATYAALIDHLNRPTASISLVPIGQTAEHGESVSDDWIFFLTIDDLSDHLYWAIVDREGLSPTYNYGFN